MAITINSFTPSNSVASVTEGSTLTMSVNATEDQGYALLYQWQQKSPGTSTWVTVPGATQPTYTTPTLNAVDDATYYRVLVYTVSPSQQQYAPGTNGVEINMVPATIILVSQQLNENYAVSIGGTIQMEHRTTLSGGAADVESNVNTINYQWQVSNDSGSTWNNVVIGGDISVLTETIVNTEVTPSIYIKRSVLTYSNIPFTQNLKQYRVVVTSSIASNSPFTSDPTAIIVGASITITKQPGTGTDVTSFYKYNPSDTTSGFTTLTTTASSSAGSFSTLSYQWQYRYSSEDNFEDIVGTGNILFNCTGYDTDSLYLYEVKYLPYFEIRCVISGTALETNAITDVVDITTLQLVVMTTNVNDITIAENSFTILTATVNTNTVTGTAGDVYTKWQQSVDSGNTWTDITSYELNSNPLYTTPSLTSSNSGILYRVQVDGQDCTNEPFYSPDASGAEITVFSFVTINASPAQTSVFNNQIASFAVSATSSNSATLSYQWQVSTNSGSSWSNISNGGIYTGANTNLLLIDPATVSMSGYRYRCVVNAPNTISSVTSSYASLSVYDDVFTSITSINDRYLYEFDALEFSVTAQSASLSAISYQWQKSTNYNPNNPTAATWSDISGAQSSTFSIASVSPSDEGYYRCKLTSFGGTITYTNAAFVDVVSLAITVTANNPSNVSVIEFENNTLTLSVIATPTINSDLTFEWQYNSNPTGSIGWSVFGSGFGGSSPNSANYTPQAFTRAQTGLRVRCKVNGTGIPGDWYSNETVIEVIRRVTFIPIPSTVSIASNEYQTIDISLVSTGGSVTYQWQYRTSSSGSWINAIGYDTQAINILGYASSNQLPSAGSLIVQDDWQIRCLVSVTDASQYQYFTASTGLVTTNISPAGSQIVVNPSTNATIDLLSASIKPIRYSFETSKVGAAIGTVVCIPKPGGYVNPGSTGGDDSMSWNKPHSSVATSDNATKLKYDGRFVGWIPLSASNLMTGNMDGATLNAAEFPELARIMGNTFGGSINAYVASTGYLPPKTGNDGTSGGVSGTFALPLVFGKKLFGTGKVNNNGASVSVVTRFTPTGGSGSLNQIGYIGGDYNYDELEQLPPGSNPNGTAGNDAITPSTFTIGSFKTQGWEDVSIDISTSYNESISWSAGPLSTKTFTSPTQHQHFVTSYAAVPESITQKIGRWQQDGIGTCSAKQVNPEIGLMIAGVPYIDAQQGHIHGLSLTDASADGSGHGSGRGGVGSDTVGSTLTQANTGSFVSNGTLVMSKQSNTLWNSQLVFKLENAEKMGIITPQYRLKYYIKAW